MSCEDVKKELYLFLYGELSAQQEEEFEQHFATCDGCRAELERERLLHSAFDLSDTPVAPVVLGECRRDLFAQVRRETEAERRSRGVWQRLTSAFDLRSAWLRPVGAMALVAVGFFSARLIGPAAPQLADVKGTRVRFVQPSPEGVRLVLEETRERVVSGSLADENIQKWVLAAATDPADASLRVDSIDLLKSRPDAENVRRALMHAVVADPNPGVRLKALEGLKPLMSDTEVRNTLSQVLLRDNNTALRTQAIDLLIQQGPHDMVGVFQQLMQVEEEPYIRHRTQQALTDMNASVEAF